MIKDIFEESSHPQELIWPSLILIVHKATQGFVLFLKHAKLCNEKYKSYRSKLKWRFHSEIAAGEGMLRPQTEIQKAHLL